MSTHFSAFLKASTSDANFNYAFETLTGSTTILMGPSASGKSTFLRSVAGLHRETSGTLKIGTKTLFDSSNKIRVPPFRRNIGFVFQSPAIFSFISVEKNLLFSLKFSKEIDPEFHPDKIKRKLGLNQILHKSVPTLSGGEKQRLALGRTLISAPEILLLDEPLSALDQSSKLQIIDYLNEISSKKLCTTIYVTHSDVEEKLIHGQRVEISEIRTLT